MNVQEAIRKRYSVRSYHSREVEEEKLSSLLEAARLAPSASNRQEWRFVVVRDPARRKGLADAAGQPFVGEAPIVLVCCADTDEHRMRCGELSYPIDVAIAIEHVTLTATEMGLGTCWIGSFDQEKVKRLLNIPARIRVVELLPVGYPADSPRPKSRLPLKEVVCYETWAFGK